MAAVTRVAWMEVMLLLGLGGGGASNDLVSWMDADLYFQSREIKLEAPALAAQAAKEPKDAAASVAQLLAIRWLGEHPAETKQSKEAREVLEQLAAGKGAQDRLGFAREYARRALVRLDGKRPAPEELPDNSVKADALTWFPADSALVGAVDLRAVSDDAALSDVERLRGAVIRLVPLAQLTEFYNFVDKVGNMRLDRISFAYAVDPEKPNQKRIFIRVTGLGDHQRFLAFLRETLPNAAVKEEKGPRGEPISIVSTDKRPPAFALFGDTEIAMAGDENTQGDHAVILRQLMEVRSGNKPNVLTGALAARLKDVPARASAMFAGDLPNDMRQQMSRGLPFPVPRAVVAQVTRAKVLAVHVTGIAADADEAKKTAEILNGLKQQGLDKLKEVPAEEVKPAQLAVIRKTLEGVKIEADGANIKGNMEIGTDALKVMLELFEMKLREFNQR